MWKVINGNQNYEISDKGEFRSIDKVIVCKNRWGKIIDRKYKGRIFKSVVNNSGYKIVTYKNSEGKIVCNTIHHLVAEAYIPNPNNYSDVNHIDGNKFNNDVSNLEWCTHKENIQKAYDTGLFDQRDDKMRATIAKRTFWTEVEEIRYKKNSNAVKIDGVIYNSRKEASEKLQITTARICQRIKQGTAEIIPVPIKKTILVRNYRKGEDF